MTKTNQNANMIEIENNEAVRIAAALDHYATQLIENARATQSSGERWMAVRMLAIEAEKQADRLREKVWSREIEGGRMK